MRIRTLTATQYLHERNQESPDVATMSAVLLRPFLDLTTSGTAPITSQVAGYVGASLTAGEDGDWLPPQGNTRRTLRASLIRESGLDDYDISRPAQLPAHRMTRPWQALIDAVDNGMGLTDLSAYRAVCALYKVGLFGVAVELGGFPDPETLVRHDLRALTALRSASAASKLGRGARDMTQYTVAVHRHAPPGGRARLAAAINLCIHCARTRGWRHQVPGWAAEITAELARLRPEDRPHDTFMASIGLRAAAFEPFIRSDHATTSAMLDRAERYARQASTLADVAAPLARENLYAVLETRTNAAVASGDRAAALRYVTELVELDPWEPRAWLQLGDVHWDDGRITAAAAAFRSAARLGAPCTAIAWYCVGRCEERLGHADLAGPAYATSVAAQPLGISAIAGLGRTARRTGRSDLAEWTGFRLRELHRRATGIPAQRTETRTGGSR